MRRQRGVLRRLLVRACPQFLEDWLGAAGSRFQRGLSKLSQYNRDHAHVGEKVDQVPDLVWKAAEGAASAQHAKAEADYARAENDRIEAELRRRTMEARTRHECAEADKAEAEVGIARVREMQARLELFKELRDLGVSVTLDTSLNLVVTQARPSPPLEAAYVFASDEVGLVLQNLIEVKCPEFENLPAEASFTFTKWLVSVGSRVSEKQLIAELAASVSPSSLCVPSPAAGVVNAICTPIGSPIVPGQTIATILTEMG